MSGPTDARDRGAGPLGLANAIAIVVPLALLAGAWSFQIWGGLFPCEMCWWQRYGQIAALGFAILALLLGRNRARPRLVITLVRLAGLGIAASALIAGYHAGIEYGWWHGVTACTSLIKFGGGDPLAAIMNSPAVRCDEVQWQLARISLAGFNFLISGLAAGVIFLLLTKAAKEREI